MGECRCESCRWWERFDTDSPDGIVRNEEARWLISELEQARARIAELEARL